MARQVASFDPSVSLYQALRFEIRISAGRCTGFRQFVLIFVIEARGDEPQQQEEQKVPRTQNGLNRFRGQATDPGISPFATI